MKKPKEKPLILIVEDSPVETEIIKRSVAKDGYEVASARNGFEGLEAMMARKPAIVLSDINMPQMNGFEMCSAIKGRREFRGVPVMLISALSEPEDVIMAITAGADAYITKPYDENTLLFRIKTLISASLESKGDGEEEENLDIEYKGKLFTASVNYHRMVNILLSVYENLISQNHQLTNIQTQLAMLNDGLEEKVRERTQALNREIEGRVRMEEALQESEELHRAIMETANDAIICINLNGKVCMWNRRAEKMFGYTAQEASEKKVHDFITPEKYRKKASAGFAKFLATGEGAIINRTTEVTALRRDGSEFPIELSIAPVKMKDGWGASAIIKDITARKERERKLTQTNEKLKTALDNIEKTQKMLVRSEKLAALGQLAAGVGHELKNPLNIIYTSAQLVMMEEGLSGEVAESTKIIMEQVMRAVKIIDNLRDFARERKPETKEIDLHPFIEKTMSLVSYEMKGEGIEMALDFFPEPIRIMGDEDQLAQVFLNITNNGRDSMNLRKKTCSFEDAEKIGWKPTFTVRTRMDDGKVKISFEDNGIGISEDNKRKMFTPFFTTKGETNGTGLGIAISLGIIENHGGTIEVESEEGKGAAFTIVLPVSA